MFFVWTPGTWDQPIFMSEHFLSISATGVVGECLYWPISGHTDGGDWIRVPSGKRGMVRAGIKVRRDVHFRGSCRWGEGWVLTGLRTPRIFHHWEVRLRQFGDVVIKSYWTAMKGW